MKSRLLKWLMVVGVALTTAEASAAGYYNMPTNLRQCLGYGYGPGYHAPMLLGPAMKAGTEAKLVRRTPRAFAPPPRGWSDAPTVLPSGYAPQGVGGWESYLGSPAPAMYGPVLQPAPFSPSPVEAYAPETVPAGPRFE